MNDISIIMLCHNSRSIDICVSALSAQMQGHDELLIVDDHSDPIFLEETVTPLVSDSIHVLHAQKYSGNRSYNRNLGAQHAKNNILLFVDGDMVLQENALNVLRKANESDKYVAFIGAEHGMKDSELHMALRLGHRDYLNLLKTREGRNILFHNPLLSDTRRQDLMSNRFEPYFWIYFYTSFCAIKRSIFEQIGGFDQNFLTWGSEDVDIGYRLSLIGRIGYLPDFEGLHVPHERNIWEQETLDRDNIRYIVDKYRKWPLELLSAFDSSCPLYSQMEIIYSTICKQKTPPINILPEPDTIWINLPVEGKEHETVQWFSGDGTHHSAALLGIALPFCDYRFKSSYITSNIFAYPDIVIARILMESLRVSSATFLIPAETRYRYAWDEEAFAFLTTLHHVCAISCDPMEFSFQVNARGWIEVHSPENQIRLKRAFSQTPVFPSAQSRQKWTSYFLNHHRKYCLINLTDTNSDLVKTKLQNAFGIQIGLLYSFAPPAEAVFSFSDVLPLTLCQNRDPMLYIVSDFNRIAPSCMWQRDCSQDLVYDQTGTLRRYIEIDAKF